MERSDYEKLYSELICKNSPDERFLTAKLRDGEKKLFDKFLESGNLRQQEPEEFAKDLIEAEFCAHLEEIPQEMILDMLKQVLIRFCVATYSMGYYCEQVRAMKKILNQLTVKIIEEEESEVNKNYVYLD